MAVSGEYRQYVRDILSVLGPLRIRAMFGGLGVYCDDLFFALVIGDQLYFKADAQSRHFFEAEGCLPFEYEKQGKIQQLNYFVVPEVVYEDEDELRYWGGLALSAARRARAKS